MLESVKKVWYKIIRKSFDPVKILPKKVMENILGSMRGNDLLTLSMVSKNWYSFIATSPVCMNKIRVHISEYFLNQKRVFTMDDMLLLVERGREYKHLTIACISGNGFNVNEFSTAHKLLIMLYKWKSVSLYNHIFKTEMHFVDFLGCIEPFVEELELRTVKVLKLIGLEEVNLNFPKLRVLRLVNVSNVVFGKAFENVKKLKEFTVATEPFTPLYAIHTEMIRERVQGISNILNANPKINDLEMFLDQKDFDCLFISRVLTLRIEFRLKNLIVGRFKKVPNNHFQIKNFVRFLHLHVESLNDFSIHEYLGEEALEIAINDMKNLKNLAIHNLELYDDRKLNITSNNSSIESLKMISNFSKGPATTVLMSVPNLKHLNTMTIDQKILEVLATKTPKLESIRVYNFIPSSPPTDSILENLKLMRISIRTNESFEDSIKNKEKFTNFERIFLKSAKRLHRRWNVNNKSFYK
jgi:hypothetical protein